MLYEYFKNKTFPSGVTIPFTAQKRDEKEIHELGIKEDQYRSRIYRVGPKATWIYCDDGYSCSILFNSKAEADEITKQLRKLRNRNEGCFSNNIGNAVLFMRIPEFLERNAD